MLPGCAESSTSIELNPQMYYFRGKSTTAGSLQESDSGSHQRYRYLASRLVISRMCAIIIPASDETMDRSTSLASRRGAEPCEGSLGDPATRKNLEAFGLIGALDDFNRPAPDLLEPPIQLVARIAAIGEDMGRPRPPVTDRFQHIKSTVAILDICTMHNETDHQTKRIDDDVTRAALDPLARGIAPDTIAFRGFHALPTDHISPSC